MGIPLRSGRKSYRSSQINTHGHIDTFYLFYQILTSSCMVYWYGRMGKLRMLYMKQ